MNIPERIMPTTAEKEAIKPSTEINVVRDLGDYWKRRCYHCRADISDRRLDAQFCGDCIRTGKYLKHMDYHRRAMQGRAIYLVNQAVRKGKLPPVKGQQCTDCDGRATEYEHRDYLKPLDVEPVCRRCNIKRGPATQSLDR